MPASSPLVGRRLGVYQVHSLLGVGGMGEVYRARDTRLGRDVAIKILPHDVADDAERLARFEREARVLASLNHPHIGAIYGFEDATTDVGLRVRGLVLELVEGETLADRLTRGAIDIHDALAIARQIADALDAAHQRGIIHRDLKPANVKVTPAGLVKVLDFGIAKTAAPDAPDQEAAPTTMAATRDGVVLGTAPYMSPEQVRGQSLDKRTDIWAFGCVLYEMLTGRQPFFGATPSDTIAAILHREPDWDAIPRQTPAGVIRLTKRCLQKDPQQRLRDLGDVDLALDVAASAATVPAYPSWIFWAVATSAAVAITIAVALGLGTFRATPPPAMPIRFQIPSPVTLTEAGTFSVSPDGRDLIFGGRAADGILRLWIRSLDTLETKALPGTESEDLNFTPPMIWSPDGRAIAFYSPAGSTIKRIDRAGGLPRVVCEVPGVGVGGSWNTADVILVGNTVGGIVRCPAAGGPSTPVTVLNPSLKDAAHLMPSFLPDNRHFVYLRVSRVNPAESGLVLGDLETPPDRQATERLVATSFGGAYVPGRANGSFLLFVRDRALLAQPFDPRRGTIAGEPAALANDVGVFRDSASFSASSNMLVYRADAPTLQLTWLDRRGVTKGLVGDAAGLGAATLSPDETKVVMWRDSRLSRSNRELWLVDLLRNTSTPFETNPEADVPAWSVDGRDVFFLVGTRGAIVHRKRADGSSPAEILLQPGTEGMPVVSGGRAMAPTTDGRFLIFGAEGVGTASDLWLLPVAGGGKPSPLIRQDFDQSDGRPSPDGRWLAYVSNESGLNEVFVRALTRDAATGVPVVGASRLVSKSGGLSPRWRKDGKELFYQSPAAAVMAVTVENGAFGTPLELFRAPGIQPDWSVSADGQRFLVAAPSGQMTPFTVIANWESSIKY